MPKAYSAIRAIIAFGIAIGACSRAPCQSYPKLKEIPPCPQLVAAAATNLIFIDRTDSLLNTNILRVGDSATFLGTFVLHSNRSQWLLFVRTTAPNPTNKPPENPKPLVLKLFGEPISFPSKPVPAALCMLGPFSVAGTSKLKSQKKEDSFLLNEGFLGVGLDQAANVIWQRSKTTNTATATNLLAKLTPAEKRALSGALPALISYFDIVRHTEGLEDLLRKVVDTPSLWSVVRHRGFNAGLTFGREVYLANPADWTLPDSVPVYYLPTELRINDKTALKVTFVVTAPHPPLLICGGIIGILAEKPSDDSTYLTLRVISARCAPESSVENENQSTQRTANNHP